MHEREEQANLGYENLSVTELYGHTETSLGILEVQSRVFLQENTFQSTGLKPFLWMTKIFRAGGTRSADVTFPWG